LRLFVAEQAALAGMRVEPATAIRAPPVRSAGGRMREADGGDHALDAELLDGAAQRHVDGHSTTRNSSLASIIRTSGGELPPASACSISV